jgi:hypothetical protein
MCTTPAPERLDGFYSCAVFKSFSIIGQSLLNLNNPALEIRALQAGTKHIMAIISKTATSILIKFQKIMEIISLHKTAYVVPP